MSAPLNTYGLTPLKRWKLWEIEGWQLLIFVEEDEDDEERDAVIFTTGVDQLGEGLTLKITGSPDAAQKIFEMSANDETGARKCIQQLLDQLHSIMPDLAERAAQA